jgi:glycosyltransferase involved in cell wall biosynthesis
MFSLNRSNFHEIRLPLTHEPGIIMRPLFNLWLIFVLPLWCRKKRIDLVHLPNTLFVSGWFPTISTIHDVVEYKAPKYSALRTFFRKLMILSAIKNSGRIITVSESTKRDLVSLGAKNVTAIYLGFTNPFQKIPDTDQKRVLEKYDLLNAQYILCIGTLLRHKNIPTLIAAFSRVRETQPLAKLVLIGSHDNDFKNVMKAIGEYDLGNHVHILNYVSAAEKLTILKKASVFCLISSYEGFGIPVLEAQAAGVPVIVNNVSSLPEIGGEGVLAVGPANLEEETANGIISLLTDLGRRENIVTKGYDNIKRFSWHRFSEKTLKVYLDFSNK